MPLYRYVGYVESGKKIQGMIDADSLDLAKERLRKQKIFIKSLLLSNQKEKELSLDPSLLLAFTRELAQLLKAGLPLYEGLLTIEEKYRTHKAHPLFLDLCDQLKNGHHLSASLQKYSKIFDEIYISMVKAGEETGSLPYVYEQLSKLIEKNQQLRKKLKSALIYPAFLGSFCLIVVFSLLFFVIPSMQDLFEGRALHPMTEAVLKLSHFIKSKGIYLLLAICITTFSIIVFSKKKEGKLAIQKILLKTPFFKTVIVQSAVVRFSRALSILLLGGVPLLEGLAMTKKVMKLVSFETWIDETMEGISQGKNLSAMMGHNKLMPPLVNRMIKTGEETGKLQEMLQNVAEIFESDVEKNLDQMTTFIQPVLLLILGAIVGLILLSILLPLTDVSSFMS